MRVLRTFTDQRLSRKTLVVMALLNAAVAAAYTAYDQRTRRAEILRHLDENLIAYARPVRLRRRARHHVRLHDDPGGRPDPLHVLERHGGGVRERRVLEAARRL
jgi:hypothetical protein